MIAQLGSEVAQFQEESGAFDEVAAQVLALDRRDLPCMTMLLFGGPATVDRLAGALQASRLSVSSTVGRLQLAGYARRRPGGRAAVVELTEHAREWIERIWAPLGDEGARLMADYSTRDLATMLGFMRRACDVQERHLRTLRAWLQHPLSRRRLHLRGGLAPAALRRVEVFVEANLERPIHLPDLAARAGAEPASLRACVQDLGRRDTSRVRRGTPIRAGPAPHRRSAAVACGHRRHVRLRDAEPVDDRLSAPNRLHARRVDRRREAH